MADIRAFEELDPDHMYPFAYPKPYCNRSQFSSAYLTATTCEEARDPTSREDMDEAVLVAEGVAKIADIVYPEELHELMDVFMKYDEPLQPIPVGASVFYFIMIAWMTTFYFTYLGRKMLSGVKEKLDLHPEANRFPNLPLYWLQQSRREAELRREVRNTWAWLARRYLLSPNDPLLANVDQVLGLVNWHDFEVTRNQWSLIKCVLKQNALFVKVRRFKNNKRKRVLEIVKDTELKKIPMKGDQVTRVFEEWEVGDPNDVDDEESVSDFPAYTPPPKKKGPTVLAKKPEPEPKEEKKISVESESVNVMESTMNALFPHPEKAPATSEAAVEPPEITRPAPQSTRKSPPTTESQANEKPVAPMRKKSKKMHAAPEISAETPSKTKPAAKKSIKKSKPILEGIKTKDSRTKSLTEPSGSAKSVKKPKKSQVAPEPIKAPHSDHKASKPEKAARKSKSKSKLSLKTEPNVKIKTTPTTVLAATPKEAKSDKKMQHPAKTRKSSPAAAVRTTASESAMASKNKAKPHKKQSSASAENIVKPKAPFPPPTKPPSVLPSAENIVKPKPPFPPPTKPPSVLPSADNIVKPKAPFPPPTKPPSVLASADNIVKPKPPFPPPTKPPSVLASAENDGKPKAPFPPPTKPPSPPEETETGAETEAETIGGTETEAPTSDESEAETDSSDQTTDAAPTETATEGTSLVSMSKTQVASKANVTPKSNAAAKPNVAAKSNEKRQSLKKGPGTVMSSQSRTKSISHIVTRRFTDKKKSVIKDEPPKPRRPKYAPVYRDSKDSKAIDLEHYMNLKRSPSRMDM